MLFKSRFFCSCTFSVFSFFTFTLSGCRFSLPRFIGVTFSVFSESHRKRRLISCLLPLSPLLHKCLCVQLSSWCTWLALFENILLNQYSVCCVLGFFIWYVLPSACLTERILQCKFAKCCNREGHFYFYKNIAKKYVYSHFKAEHCKCLYLQLAHYIFKHGVLLEGDLIVHFCHPPSSPRSCDVRKSLVLCFFHRSLG